MATATMRPAVAMRAMVEGAVGSGVCAASSGAVDSPVNQTSSCTGGAADCVLSFRRLSPLSVLPSYQTAHAAGMDLHAAIAAPVVIEPGSIVMIPLGFAMAIPAGHEAQVRPRSGLGSRGITLPNSPGTIDADYRGEVRVPLINHSREPFAVEPGMRIAQMVIAPVARAVVVEVAELDATVRGEGGFGSTGR